MYVMLFPFSLPASVSMQIPGEQTSQNKIAQLVKYIHISSLLFIYQTVLER